jgi:hypothetical protein
VSAKTRFTQEYRKLKVFTGFPSRYFKAGNIEGEKRLVISRVVIENPSDSGDSNDNRPVVYFHEAAQGLVLNKTNAESLAEHFGEETDDWTDREVILYPTTTTYLGKRVPCVRVRVETNQEANGEEIPF